MRAAILEDLPATRLHLRDMEPLVPESDEVVVQVEACGICGTDLHIMSGGSYSPSLPFVLGHEPVGRVVSVGSDVSDSNIGQRVTATLFLGCGHCRPCLAGDERLCESGAKVTGVLGRPGGFADQLILKASQLVMVPIELNASSAAALVDAGATAHNAARVVQGHRELPDGPCLVVGAGPVGLLAAEILRSAGYEVVIAERNAARRREAQAFGFQASDSLTNLFPPFASVVDCAADPEMVGPEIELLHPRGLYLSVGYCTVPNFDLAVVARRELTIRGVRSGSRHDLVRVLDLAARGEIRLPTLREWPLADVNDALSALRDGVVAGKAVLVMDGEIE